MKHTSWIRTALLAATIAANTGPAKADTTVGQLLEYCLGTRPDHNNPILGQNYCYYYIEGFVNSTMINQSITHTNQICIPNDTRIRDIIKIFTTTATPNDQKTIASLHLYLTLTDRYPCH